MTSQAEIFTMGVEEEYQIIQPGTYELSSSSNTLLPTAQQALLALSANSPFWLGEDTGYASFRTLMWSRWPTSGQPQHFSSLDEYNALLQALIATGSIEDATKIYWDIRLSERFNTIEFRVTDCSLTVDETVMITGLIRAIVQTCYQQARRDDPLQVIRPELLRVSHWQAARYGISSDLIDVVAQRPLAAAAMMEKMLSAVRLRWKLRETGRRLLHWCMRRYGTAMEPCANGLPTSATNAWKMSSIISSRKPEKQSRNLLRAAV